MKQSYRHGDVSLHTIATLPAKLNKIGSNKFSLKEGEQTGHYHLLEGAFDIYEDEQGRRYLDIKKQSKLSHQEHNTITIEKGFYLQEQENEYDPFEEEINNVQD